MYQGVAFAARFPDLAPGGAGYKPQFSPQLYDAIDALPADARILTNNPQRVWWFTDREPTLMGFTRPRPGNSHYPLDADDTVHEACSGRSYLAWFDSLQNAGDGPEERRPRPRRARRSAAPDSRCRAATSTCWHRSMPPHADPTRLFLLGKDEGMTALDDLVTLLDLESIEVNIFRGRSPDESRQRVFGGQVAGQALVAATRTVDDPGRQVHSLHAYFLRPGDPLVPILYEVDRIRDGRSFTTRRVVAIQHGKAIFNLQASFHLHEPGADHQLTMPTDVPDPEIVARLQDTHGAVQGADGRVVRPAAADRRALHRSAIRSTGRTTRRTASGCGCAPTASCRTTPRCTPASSRTPAT